MPKKKKASKNDNERIAFVISPVGEPDSSERKRADQILKHIIEPVVSESGYTAIRADKISKPGIITTQIINHIINDPLVIADLTGHNPNVFYELAVRHAIKKPTIQIIQKGEKIPFDVSIQRTIKIDHKDLDSVDEARKELKRQMKAVERDATLVDSPISTAINFRFLKESGNPQNKAIAELRGTLQGVSGLVEEIHKNLVARQRRAPARASIFTPSYPIYYRLPSSPETEIAIPGFQPSSEELPSGSIDWVPPTKKKKRQKRANTKK